jgi:hypothetical protein
MRKRWGGGKREKRKINRQMVGKKIENKKN